MIPEVPDYESMAEVLDRLNYWASSRSSGRAWGFSNRPSGLARVHLWWEDPPQDPAIFYIDQDGKLVEVCEDPSHYTR